MQRKKKKEKDKDNANNILARIKEAWNYKDWGDVSYILDRATKEDIASIKTIIPDLIKHHEWIVRASVISLIGNFRLRQFLSLIKAGLQDRNSVVKGYSLIAYYDIMGSRALPVIEEYVDAKDIRLRLTALSLKYIKTGDMDALKKFSKFLTRKRCKPIHRSAFTHIFDYYCNTKQLREIVKLYEEILSYTPKSHWAAKDIRRMLKKWKQKLEKK